MQRILLASHGTVGAKEAEKAALNRLGKGDELHQIMVVPDFWGGMQGDDWLNNASTRDVFAEYVETTLADEVQTEFTRLKEAVEALGIQYYPQMAYGNPVDCLLRAVAILEPELVIAGAPRPKSQTGLRSRMITDDLMRKLTVPLVIIPYPDDNS